MAKQDRARATNISCAIGDFAWERCAAIRSPNPTKARMKHNEVIIAVPLVCSTCNIAEGFACDLAQVVRDDRDDT